MKSVRPTVRVFNDLANRLLKDLTALVADPKIQKGASVSILDQIDNVSRDIDGITANLNLKWGQLEGLLIRLKKEVEDNE